MTDKVLLDIPTEIVSEKLKHARTIKWCEGHWSRLMFALKDRGLGEQIASTPEELNERLGQGLGDPCWDACSMINIGAIEIFGADKIVTESAGCPACAFANMIEHAADIAAQTHGDPH